MRNARVLRLLSLRGLLGRSRAAPPEERKNTRRVSQHAADAMVPRWNDVASVYRLESGYPPCIVFPAARFHSYEVEVPGAPVIGKSPRCEWSQVHTLHNILLGKVPVVVPTLCHCQGRISWFRANSAMLCASSCSARYHHQPPPLSTRIMFSNVSTQ